MITAVLIVTPGCAAEPSRIDTSRVEASSNNEEREREIISAAVINAIAEEDFGRLNAMADQFRTSRARTPSGHWKSSIMYYTLEWQFGQGLDRKTGCKYHYEDFIQKWRQFSPDQPATIIATANMYLDRAWCVRGGGYADTVDDTERRGFYRLAQKSYDVLHANREKASIDPEYYALTASTYVALGKSRDEMIALVDMAAAQEPYYLRTYFAASVHFLPKWYGDATQFDIFARYAAEKTRASDQTGFYYRVYWNINQSSGEKNELNWDWNDAKKSMRDIYGRYPVAFNANQMIQETCKAGDIDEAKYCMRALHPEAPDDSFFALMIDSCKTQTAGLM